MRKDNTKKDIINEHITSPEVFLIGEDGERLGVKPLHRALQKAEQKGLDLMLVNPLATPPVARICDAKRLRYLYSKREKANKKKSAITETKSLQYRYKISPHDRDIKTAKARKFLEQGKSLKLEFYLKGREIQFMHLLRQMKMNVVEELSDISKVMSEIRSDRKIIVNLKAK